MASGKLVLQKKLNHVYDLQRYGEMTEALVLKQLLFRAAEKSLES